MIHSKWLKCEKKQTSFHKSNQAGSRQAAPSGGFDDDLMLLVPGICCSEIGDKLENLKVFTNSNKN